MQSVAARAKAECPIASYPRVQQLLSAADCALAMAAVDDFDLRGHAFARQREHASMLAHYSCQLMWAFTTGVAESPLLNCIPSPAPLVAGMMILACSS